MRLKYERARTGGTADAWPENLPEDLTKMAEESMKSIGPERMAAMHAEMSNMDPAALSPPAPPPTPPWR